VSRLHTLRAGSARTAELAAAIRAAADDPSIAVVRLKLLYTRNDRPYRAVIAYDADCWQLGLPRDAAEIIDMLVRGRRPDIDWVFDHDWHLDTGLLRRSPGVTDNGYIPQDDKCFGGTDPVFLITDARTTSPAATAPRSAA